jgi:hypothetical protein
MMRQKGSSPAPRAFLENRAGAGPSGIALTTLRIMLTGMCGNGV